MSFDSEAEKIFNKFFFNKEICNKHSLKQYEIADARRSKTREKIHNPMIYLPIILGFITIFSDIQFEANKKTLIAEIVILIFIFLWALRIEGLAMEYKIQNYTVRRLESCLPFNMVFTAAELINYYQGKFEYPIQYFSRFVNIFLGTRLAAYILIILNLLLIRFTAFKMNAMTFYWISYALIFIIILAIILFSVKRIYYLIKGWRSLKIKTNQ